MRDNSGEPLAKARAYREQEAKQAAAAKEAAVSRIYAEHRRVLLAAGNRHTRRSAAALARQKNGAGA